MKLSSSRILRRKRGIGNGRIIIITVLRRRAAFQRRGNWMKWNETRNNYQRIQLTGEGEKLDK